MFTPSSLASAGRGYARRATTNGETEKVVPATPAARPDIIADRRETTDGDGVVGTSASWSTSGDDRSVDRDAAGADRAARDGETKRVAGGANAPTSETTTIATMERRDAAGRRLNAIIVLVGGGCAEI